MSNGLGIVVIIVLFGAAGYLTYQLAYHPAQAPDVSPERTFVCATTLRPFVYRLSIGETAPILSPFTNERTAYPAEACWWTEDGGRSDKPHYVILNEHLGKSGDTICPVCGHVVVAHNHAPSDKDIMIWRSQHPDPAPSDESATAGDGNGESNPDVDPSS